MLIYVVLEQCAICLKFLSSFFCSSKSFLNFRLSSTRLLINWFLLKETCSSKSFLNFRLSSTRLLINWFLLKRRVVLKVS